MEGNVKGFKVFNPDWTCRGYQYEVGKTYEENVIPMVCDRGFHFCKQARNFNRVKFKPIKGYENLYSISSKGDVVSKLLHDTLKPCEKNGYQVDGKKVMVNE